MAIAAINTLAPVSRAPLTPGSQDLDTGLLEVADGMDPSLESVPTGLESFELPKPDGFNTKGGGLSPEEVHSRAIGKDKSDPNMVALDAMYRAPTIPSPGKDEAESKANYAKWFDKYVTPAFDSPAMKAAGISIAGGSGDKVSVVTPQGSYTADWYVDFGNVEGGRFAFQGSPSDSVASVGDAASLDFASWADLVPDTSESQPPGEKQRASREQLDRASEAHVRVVQSSPV